VRRFSTLIKIALDGDGRFDGLVAMKLFTRRPHLGANFVDLGVEFGGQGMQILARFAESGAISHDEAAAQ
jgi:hypothetical protein